MSKPQVTIAVVNITAHPHDGPKTYRDLLRRAVHQRMVVPIHGDRHAVISMVVGKGDESVWGRVSTFVRFDRDAPFFNLERGEPASEEEVASIVFPKGVFPGLKEATFFFDLRHHRLAFEVGANSTWISRDPRESSRSMIA